MDADLTIIGAGVIGLAIASECARPDRTVYLLERHDTFGTETSSRNSEVIHGGLYYRPGSLKAQLCLEGNSLLYQICQDHDIPHAKIGKLIVGNTDSEEEKLYELFHNASQCGIGSDRLEFISPSQIKNLEPHIQARTALFSPFTGIIDSHRLMRHFLIKAEKQGCQVIYRTCVDTVEALEDGYHIKVGHSCSNAFEFTSRLIVNAAGLDAHNIAAMLGRNYPIHYCKGSYFSLAPSRSGMVSRLVYPPPEIAGLGIHVTRDLGGRMRLGPDTEYVSSPLDLTVMEEKRHFFHWAVKSFLPFLHESDLEPDIAGIRPKLQGPGMGFRDFEIVLDSPGAVHLVGIESPGLTASPAIARYVAKMLKEKAGWGD